MLRQNLRKKSSVKLDKVYKWDQQGTCLSSKVQTWWAIKSTSLEFTSYKRQKDLNKMSVRSLRSRSSTLRAQYLTRGSNSFHQINMEPSKKLKIIHISFHNQLSKTIAIQDQNRARDHLTPLAIAQRNAQSVVSTLLRFKESTKRAN